MDAPLSIEELIQEFDVPSINDWKLFSQSPGIIVYRRCHQNLFYYKCYSTFADISPEVSYNVAIDIEYRLVWDKYLKGYNLYDLLSREIKYQLSLLVEARKINDGNKQGVYWQVVLPLFMSNRDCTFIQENDEYDIRGRHFYYVFTRGEQFANEPPRKKVVRIETCQSQTLICSDGVNGLKSICLYCEDPRGSLPKALWSWAAKFGIPFYAKLAYNACRMYPKWIEDKTIVLPNVADNEIDRATTSIDDEE